MYVCMYVYTRVCMYALCTCVRVTHTRTSMQTDKCMHTHTNMYNGHTCTCTRTHAHTHAHTQTGVCDNFFDYNFVDLVVAMYVNALHAQRKKSK